MSHKTDTFDDEIVRLLEQGGVGLLPTDTIYGLSARALDRTAVERVHELKKRDRGKPLIVLISDIKMLDLLSISSEQTNFVKRYWPGPLSAILLSDAPEYLTLGTHSLAVRLPDFPELGQLIDKVGPIVSSSANLKGEDPVRTAAEAMEIFGDKLDYYVDAGELDNQPSTLVSIKDGKLNVVRQGSVIIKI